MFVVSSLIQDSVDVVSRKKMSSSKLMVFMSNTSVVVRDGVYVKHFSGCARWCLFLRNQKHGYCVHHFAPCFGNLSAGRV
jgi:hypothetical protein